MDAFTAKVGVIADDSAAFVAFFAHRDPNQAVSRQVWVVLHEPPKEVTTPPKSYLEPRRRVEHVEDAVVLAFSTHLPSEELLNIFCSDRKVKHLEKMILLIKFV